MSSTGRQRGRTRDSAPAGRAQPADTRPGAPKSPGPATMQPPRKTWLWFVVVIVANFLLVRLLLPGPEGPITVPYTLFKEEVRKGNVQAIHSQGDTITGRFKAPVTYPPASEKTAPPKSESPTASERRAPRDQPRTGASFATTLPTFVDPGLEAFLIDHGVEISAKPIDDGGSPMGTLLFGFGPALLFIGFYVWMFRRAQQGGGLSGGLMGIGKSKARRYDQEKDAKVTFDDVAGIDEAENELVEIVDFLKDPPKYARLGGTAPKGVLLRPGRFDRRVVVNLPDKIGREAILKVHTRNVPRGQNDVRHKDFLDALEKIVLGRAAEELVYGTKTTRAESDIEQAARAGAARTPGEPIPGRRRRVRWHQALQRGDRRGHRRRGAADHQREHEEVRRLLGAHRKELDALADALVARETLNEQEILEVTGLPPAPPLPSGVTAVPREGAAP